VDGTFYVTGDISAFAQRNLPTHKTALIKVSVSRHDTCNPETQLIERVSVVFTQLRAGVRDLSAQLYQLDVWMVEFHSQAFIPSRLEPGYVCDVNGPIGCSICAK
jgi:hypothetical protein